MVLLFTMYTAKGLKSLVIHQKLLLIQKFFVKTTQYSLSHFYTPAGGQSLPAGTILLET